MQKQKYDQLPVFNTGQTGDSSKKQNYCFSNPFSKGTELLQLSQRVKKTALPSDLFPADEFGKSKRNSDS